MDPDSHQIPHHQHPEHIAYEVALQNHPRDPRDHQHHHLIPLLPLAVAGPAASTPLTAPNSPPSSPQSRDLRTLPNNLLTMRQHPKLPHAGRRSGG